MPSKSSLSTASMTSSRGTARWAHQTNSIPGASSAIDAMNAWPLLVPPNTCRLTSRATRISRTTARGAPKPSTAMCGHRASPWAGRPTNIGRWVWVSPWGWTWIDDSRWGYAPFHYGRWAHVRDRWCWVPGPRHVRAVYAPALVGWGGSHGHNVSWFPLGPREVYVPGRRFSRNYWERVNFSNTYVSRARFSDAVANRVSDTVYRNRVVPGGVTAMPLSAFTSAGRTGDHRARFNQQELARTVASAVPPQIAPVRESRLGGPSRPNVRIPPASLATRQVVVRRDPPPAAAHFTRRPTPAGNAALVQAPRPSARPAVRGQVNERPERNNQDRPPRAERPVKESAPPPASSVYEPRAIADRVRVDRDRQVRERQQREDSQQREAANQQSWQRQEDQARQQREQRTSRELHSNSSISSRNVSGPSARRKRCGRPPNVQSSNSASSREQRQQSEQRQNSEHASATSGSSVERPQAERPSRSETQKPAETRSPPRERHEGNERARRN